LIDTGRQGFLTAKSLENKSNGRRIVLSVPRLLGRQP